MPWKNSMQNVEMGPKYHGVNKNTRRRSGKRFLEMVGLKGFEESYPRQLSGGMKQRVGIARAYNADAEILLMDEPFGALDAQTRYQMQDEILRIWEKDKRTVLFVTNNIEEAIYLGAQAERLCRPFFYGNEEADYGCYGFGAGIERMRY